MTHCHGHVEAAKVGDDAHAKGFDATVVCHYHLGHGAHADGIAADSTEHTVFGWRLKRGTLYAYVDTMQKPNAFFLGYGIGLGYQRMVVRLMHVGETRTRGHVLSTQGMLGKEVDMVGDQHQVANLHLGVHASGGVTHKKGLDAQFVHYTHGKGHLLHGVAFIVVETPLHGKDVHAAQLAENQLAGMAFDGGNGKMRYFGVRKLVAFDNLRS